MTSHPRSHKIAGYLLGNVCNAPGGPPGRAPVLFKGHFSEMMGPQYRDRPGAIAGQLTNSAKTWLLLAAALALRACEQNSTPALLEFPAAQAGRLEITYPLNETLFPPEIVAPTFNWSDETDGIAVPADGFEHECVPPMWPSAHRVYSPGLGFANRW